MKSADIRSSFLRFFEGQGHTIVPSDSLVPSSDPTLLFTSAGMVQFKPNFQNPDSSPYKRATSCQKCLRTSDIERVGTTLRHLTFFEMLGNFSFGDYFKKESIAWGWEFITKTMGLPADRFVVSVHKSDDEAFGMWEKLIPKTRIYRLDDDTNFWTMGPTGPCGPCSEILYDRGPEWSCGKPTCSPACDCDRYFEIWNHVFTQFDRSADGTLKPLPRKNIDTGMGLERLCVLGQGVTSAFGTDVFQSLFKELSRFSTVEMPKEPKDAQAPSAEVAAYRRIADHARAITFMISDGILPSNEGRGYVLRRLLRQAVRASKTIGIRDPFLYKMSAHVIDLMKSAYPDAVQRRETIASVIKNEEEKFLETLDSGTRRLEELVKAARVQKQSVLSGPAVFQLYDTFGFPIELTQELASSEGLKVDLEGFQAAQTQAADVARQNWKGSGAQSVDHYRNWKTHVPESTRFRGYETLAVSTQVLSPLYRKKGNAWESVTELKAGEEGEAVLPETPFYAEGGGQVGDVGLWTSDGLVAEVLDTQAPVDGLTVHSVRIKSGTLRSGQHVTATVDRLKREATMRHHTATHLLHKALREVLGTHVTQAGSLVAPDRLRFDFTHFAPLTPEQRRKIEDLVNEKTLADIPVQPHEVSIDEARQLGAMMLFGEKYGQKVRTLRVAAGDWARAKDAWSLELCGGTHVSATGQIGLFKMTSEAAVGSGVRRIEAVAGLLSLGAARQLEEKVLQLQDQLVQQKRDFEKKIDAAKSAAIRQQAQAPIQIKTVGDLRVVAHQLNDLDAKRLREASDTFRDQEKADVVVLVSVEGEKISFVVACTPRAIEEGADASGVAKKMAEVLEGSAGGRPAFAQGGGKNGGAVATALQRVDEWVRGQLKK